MPLVSRTFDQLIDFTRTSAATFVNSSGNIASTPQSRNLLTFTQEFDNAAWTKSNASVSANSTTAPDGTSTADSLIENSSNGFHAATQSYTLSGTMTLSCYVKANTRTFAALRTYDATNSDRYVVFNLSAGTVGATSASTTGTITPAGDGWYRCTMTYTFTSASGSVGLTIQNANSYVTYTGDGVSGIFIWGFQLEAASTASTYTRNFGGLFPPRFDYDPVTLAPKGLLIEEQRTNLLTYSQDIGNVAAWTQSSITLTVNSITAPDGAVTGDTITRTATNFNEAMARQATSQAVSTAYTLSCYVKAGSANGKLYFRNLAVDGSTSTGLVQFDPQTGTVSLTYGSTYTGKATMTAVGNGWYRCVIVGTTSGSIGANFVDIGVTDGSSALGGTAGDFIYIWGAQLEAGSFATSYIPTVASQVTRTADVAAINAPNFAPWYNQSEGTFVVEGSTRADGYLFAGTGTAALVSYQSPAGAIIFEAYGSPLAQISQAGNGIGATNKVAAAYVINNFGLSVNGASASTDTSAAVPTISALRIGYGYGAFGWANGYIRSIRYYPTRLTNAQLQALTA